MAAAFVAAARTNLPGAVVFSLPGPAVSVAEIVAAIEAVEPAARGRITWDERPLPFPEAFDGRLFEAAVGALRQTSLADGIRATIDCYRAAIRDGRVDGAFLGRVLA